ncbi:hypothetical protein HD806DRAFT_521821 [Xylariaceae sp. AK1471]|nr:hypothetical protein HD806DRAFT_521821 [Xylariaceae sp. AK1471]
MGSKDKSHKDKSHKSSSSSKSHRDHDHRSRQGERSHPYNPTSGPHQGHDRASQHEELSYPHSSSSRSHYSQYGTSASHEPSSSEEHPLPYYEMSGSGQTDPPKVPYPPMRFIPPVGTVIGNQSLAYGSNVPQIISAPEYNNFDDRLPPIRAPISNELPPLQYSVSRSSSFLTHSTTPQGTVTASTLHPGYGEPRLAASATFPSDAISQTLHAGSHNTGSGWGTSAASQDPSVNQSQYPASHSTGHNPNDDLRTATDHPTTEAMRSLSLTSHANGSGSTPADVRAANVSAAQINYDKYDTYDPLVQWQHNIGSHYPTVGRTFGLFYCPWCRVEKPPSSFVLPDSDEGPISIERP